MFGCDNKSARPVRKLLRVTCGIGERKLEKAEYVYQFSLQCFYMWVVVFICGRSMKR